MEMVILYWVSLEERRQPCGCPAPQCPHRPALQTLPCPCHTHLQDSLHILMQVSLWPKLLRSSE